MRLLTVLRLLLMLLKRHRRWWWGGEKLIVMLLRIEGREFGEEEEHTHITNSVASVWVDLKNRQSWCKCYWRISPCWAPHHTQSTRHVLLQVAITKEEHLILTPFTSTEWISESFMGTWELRADQLMVHLFEGFLFRSGEERSSKHLQGCWDNEKG
jgi:hypothetical protein